MLFPRAIGGQFRNLMRRLLDDPSGRRWPRGSNQLAAGKPGAVRCLTNMSVHPLHGTLPSPETCDNSRLRERKGHLNTERVRAQRNYAVTRLDVWMGFDSLHGNDLARRPGGYTA